MGEQLMSQVLFEIKEENLESGMRGYPVGYCVTSTVDPKKGLHYIGIPVSEVADWDPEEVIYLIFHGKKGTEKEIQEFSRILNDRSRCSFKTLEAIQKLPRDGHPMKLFTAALLLASIYEEKGDYREDALDVVAKLPEIVATVINHHSGWGKTPASKPELGYMENFAQMVNVPEGNKEELTRIFRIFNVLHYDHGGGNLSVFVGKAVASGLEGTYGSLAAAMCGLAGSRHGKANQDCLQFVKEVLEELGEEATADQVRVYIEKKLESHELIFGFGHAVLRVEDTRATHLYKIAQQRYANHPLVKIALLLRSEGPKVLSQNPKIADPYPNVDAISGTVLSAAGFPYPEYYTVLFGLSRCVGIARQIVYERLEARNGKGTPIIRPKYLYKERS